MITYLSRKHMGYDDQDRQILRIYIAVASSSELPTKYSIPGVAIHEASMAWDVSTGKKYGFLDASGWTEQPGSTLENSLIIKGRVNSVSDLPSDAEPGWLYYVGLATEENLPEYVYTVDGRWDQVGTNAVVITIDSSLSDTSENPVQNKVVTTAINGINSTIGDINTVLEGVL